MVLAPGDRGRGYRDAKSTCVDSGVGVRAGGLRVSVAVTSVARCSGNSRLRLPANGFNQRPGVLQQLLLSVLQIGTSREILSQRLKRRELGGQAGVSLARFAPD